MKMIRVQEMLRCIPAYPSACSLMNMGMHLGYISKDMDRESIGKVLQRMERKLFWSVLKDRRIVGAEMRTQRSTRLAMTRFGLHEQAVFPTMVYLSMDRGEAAE